MSGHRGLLNASPTMLEFHKTRHGRMMSLDRMLCAFCWVALHPGGTVKHGLGVLQGGPQDSSPEPNSNPPSGGTK